VIKQFCLDHELVLKWAAHLVIVLATIATAFDFTPANKILFLIGCVLWAYVGWLWRQPSLWTLNLFCGLVYILGLMT
jgi:hypothetical protein